MSVSFDKRFSVAILLYVRPDKPRQVSMDRWRGPHSEIIAATPGMLEYRQVHLAEEQPGLWPAVPGVQTAIPAGRRVDGVAEVAQQSALSPLRGRAQTELAYADEVNLFHRTLMYSGLPGSARWYRLPGAGTTGSRALVLLRRGDGVGGRALRSWVADELAPAIAGSGAVTELRTQVFMPWSKALWNTPDVAHDNPPAERFHASLIVGFPDDAARAAFFAGDVVAGLADGVRTHLSAVHAYAVTSTPTYVRDGRRLSQPEE